MDCMGKTYADLFMLPEIIQRVAIHLPFHTVRQYYCVCKTWCKALNCETFWKRYLFLNISFKPVKETSEIFPLTYWFPEHMIGYWDLEPDEEYTMFREMPKYLKCGIVVPSNFDVSSVTSNFQDLAQAIWILRHMKRRSTEMECTVLSFGNEGNGTIIPVLIPWNKRSIPTIEQVLDIFTIPQRMCTFNSFKLNPRLTHKRHYYAFVSSKCPSELCQGGMTPIWSVEDDSIMKKPELLASVQLDYANHTDPGSKVKKKPQPAEQEPVKDLSFESEEHLKMWKTKQWLGRIFQPSYEFYAGERMCNPTIYFHLTSLGEGFVGGVLSNSYMT